MRTDVPIYLYNTLSRSKERFEPRREGEVAVYVCGVTPYDAAHIGHARPSVVFDVFRRFLRRLGYRVTMVQNFTDVDDKIIERAKARKKDPLRLSKAYSEAYLASMDRLGIERVDAYPKVSEHIQDIIEMVQGLIDQGHAYESNGSVFFSVRTFPDYGKLSRQRREELISGARIESDESKRDPLDFALWKAAKEGEPAWESPWGPGRPGWHIECSAMSLKYLGNGFDIHGGGLDLIFPHHENEIAQAEAYTGEAPFVRYWMHNGLVNFGEEKMSKSLGNFVTVDDVLEEYDPALVRYAMLQHHYRSPMEFSASQMDTFSRGWERLNRAVDQLKAVGPPVSRVEAGKQGADAKLLAIAEALEEKFTRALADDFNTPSAIAALFEAIRDVKPYLGGGRVDHSTPERVGLQAVYGTFAALAGDILGVLSDRPMGRAQTEASSELVRDLVDLVVEVRAEARKERDFDRADRLRDRLGELGIVLEDSPEGTRWSFKD